MSFSRRHVQVPARRRGWLASLVRLRAAKANFRRNAARPTSVEPCLTGDGNGNIVAWLNPATGLPSDHIWVRMLNQGGRPMVARNFSGHAWTDGERILCEYIGTAAGHILSVIYRERLRTVLYAWAIGAGFVGNIGGNAILMIDPHDDPTGELLTWKSLGFPRDYGTDIGAFLAYKGGVYLAGGPDIGGKLWAYGGATGWVDVGLPLNNPIAGTGRLNPVHLFAHDGAAHGLVLYRLGASLPSEWRLYRLSGVVATLRGKLDTQFEVDGESGISINDLEAANWSAGSATPAGPGPIWASVEDTALAVGETLAVRKIDAPQGATLAFRTDGALTAYSRATPPNPIDQFFVSGAKFHAAKGYGPVLATDTAAPGVSWAARITEYDSPYETTRDLDAIETTGSATVPATWAAYGSVTRTRTVLYAWAVTTAIPTVGTGPEGVHLLMIDPHDDITGASTTYESLGFPADYATAGVSGDFSNFLAVNGTVYLSTFRGDVWAYTRGAGWIRLGLPTTASAVPEFNSFNTVQLFKHDGAAHGVMLFKDEGGAASYRLYRFEGAAATLIGQVSALSDDVKATVTSAGSPTPAGPGAIFFGTVNIDQTLDPSAPRLFVRRISMPQADPLTVVTDATLTAFLDSPPSPHRAGIARQWIVSGGKFHLSKGTEDVIAAPADTADWDVVTWLPRFHDLNNAFLTSPPQFDEGFVDILELPLQASARCYWTTNILFGTIGDDVIYPGLHFGPSPSESGGAVEVAYFGDILPDTLDSTQVPRISATSDAVRVAFFQPYVIGEHVYVGVQVNDPGSSGQTPALPCGIYSPSPAFDIFYTVLPGGIFGSLDTNVIGFWKGEAV